MASSMQDGGRHGSSLQHGAELQRAEKRTRPERKKEDREDSTMGTAEPVAPGGAEFLDDDDFSEVEERLRGLGYVE